MTEQYIGWALAVGGVLGGALVWFILGRLPRRTEDVAPAERREEALWIARVIESRGGIAPPALVDEVLELHGEYLAGPALDVRPEPPAPVGRGMTDERAMTDDEAMGEDRRVADEEPLVAGEPMVEDDPNARDRAFPYDDMDARSSLTGSDEQARVGAAETAPGRRTSELADEDRDAI